MNNNYRHYQPNFRKVKYSVRDRLHDEAEQAYSSGRRADPRVNSHKMVGNGSGCYRRNKNLCWR